jgi:hypothetical protein
VDEVAELVGFWPDAKRATSPDRISINGGLYIQSVLRGFLRSSKVGIIGGS